MLIAAWGTAALLLAVALGLWLTARAFERDILGRVAAVHASAPASETRPDLPPLLQRYLSRNGPSAPERARWVRIEQRGEMRLTENGPWMPFRAEQHYALSRTAFVWRARVRLARGLAVIVLDALNGGEGVLSARLLGAVPLAKAVGAPVAQGQLLRYLSEIVWFPAALAVNTDITWTQQDDRHVHARIRAGGVRAEATFTFDEAGDIVAVRAEERPRAEAGNTPTPWAGTFSDYRALGGVRVPTRALVWWELPGGLFEYWRGSVTAVASR